MRYYLNLININLLLVITGLMVAMHAMADGVAPSSMTWILEPGESVNDVARLFYPKNRQMQQRFIEKTIQLSHEAHQNINPEEATTEKSLITIPDIKSLSFQSGKNHRAQTSNQKIRKKVKNFSADTSAEKYDALVKRNNFFKIRLDKLNEKLTQLEQMLMSLKAQVMHIVNISVHVPPIKIAKDQVKKSNDLVKSQHANVEESIQDVAKTSAGEKVAINTAQTETKLVTPMQQQLIKPIYFSRYSTIVLFLLALVLFMLLVFYIWRQSKNWHKILTNSNNSLEKKATINNSVFEGQLVSSESNVDISDMSGEFEATLSDGNNEVEESLVNKEEADLVLEQARIYISLNRIKEATVLLESYIRAMPKNALRHRIYLLDIYREKNLRKEFLQCSKELHESFNVMMPQWESPALPDAIASSVEQFSHISAKVTKLWADCEKESKTIVKTKAYLDELLMDNRESERTGFSLEVFKEIMTLRDILDVREKLAIE
ncbi:MAG: hypothetical protein Q8M99_09850 [Methylotenera sp.]|nr:hypothetical protein [Methylotenera sp.]